MEWNVFELEGKISVINKVIISRKNWDFDLVSIILFLTQCAEAQSLKNKKCGTVQKCTVLIANVVDISTSV